MTFDMISSDGKGHFIKLGYGHRERLYA